MGKKKAETVLAHYSENIEQPPHILPALFDLLSGEGHPTSFEREQQLGHLAECKDCQDALRTLLAIELDQDRQVGITEKPIWKLISRLTSAIEKEQIRNDIPAYIETIELRGKEEARKRYPRLAEHLQKCKSCRSMVAGIQTLKHEAEQAGKIAPLLTDTGK
ncbi:MAG: hypothetical protein ACHQ1H_14790 [Nitrososphaerales archaeon]